MKKILALLGLITISTAPVVSVVSCSTIDYKIKQSFASWTFSTKIDSAIYGPVFKGGEINDDKWFFYWFMAQYMNAAQYEKIDITFYQLTNNNVSSNIPVPETLDIWELLNNKFWFETIVNFVNNNKINQLYLRTVLLYLSIYNPIMALAPSALFEANYHNGIISIAYNYDNIGQINEYKKEMKNQYEKLINEEISVKYPDLIPYFLSTSEANRKIEQLINSLVQVMIILQDKFTIIINILT
ncbi:hypothetical protein SSYRP_v1c10010 [Spiroplasma syrphidicola EA-1]|uniref:Lipoprotein n=1 Tax=Spiroplasma syrphidicola EA-1 TaxID=1276229 RepID=R4U7G2_9MOLU|nr:lipoprotein [Spiroplasma syrphidicola]AGM26588.1 hypothetical protein SSYRP_v1c10010 [Spiroplasma syrphidicola EA-1]